MSVALLDQQKGKVDRSALLGRIMWYTVPENTMLDYTEVINELMAVGLNRHLPGQPADSDVFRRVSKNAERRRVQRSATEFENWMMRDVASRNEDTITRRIVVEVVDSKGRRLQYEQVADIEFERPFVIPDRTVEFVNKLADIDRKIAALPPSARSRREKLRIQRVNVTQRRDNCPAPVNRPAKLRFVWLNGFGPVSHPTAQEIMEDVERNFLQWRGMLSDQAMREWIRRQVIRMGATAVRPSGGIYFLQEQFANDVEALEAFVKKMLPVGADCHSVEIPDTDKQREMVHKAIENETIGAIESMMVEIANVRQEGKLTPKRYLAMLSEIRILENKMNGYSKLLQKDMDKVRIRLQLLDQTAKGLSPLQKGK